MTTNASEIRKAMDLVEMGKPASNAVRPVDKNVQVNIQTLAREVKNKGRYRFNKGFLTFQDILDQPKPFLEKYRKESKQDTSKLTGYLAGFKADPKYTDKEHYLRHGWEARGFSNNQVVLVWFKEKTEDLMIFAHSNDAVVEIRDFLRFFNVIQ